MLKVDWQKMDENGSHKTESELVGHRKLNGGTSTKVLKRTGNGPL